MDPLVLYVIQEVRPMDYNAIGTVILIFAGWAIVMWFILHAARKISTPREEEPSRSTEFAELWEDRDAHH
jgi:hypothetical protein